MIRDQKTTSGTSQCLMSIKRETKITLSSIKLSFSDTFQVGFLSTTICNVRGNKATVSKHQSLLLISSFPNCQERKGVKIEKISFSLFFSLWMAIVRYLGGESRAVSALQLTGNLRRTEQGRSVWMGVIR